VSTAPAGAAGWSAAVDLRKALRGFTGWHLAILGRCRETLPVVGRQDRVSHLAEGHVEWCLVESRVTNIRASKLPFSPSGASSNQSSSALAPGSISRDTDDPEAEGERQELRNRLIKNLRRLRRWARREDVSCYRLYDADLPQYAVAIDIYGERWVHVQEYAPPSEIDPDRALRRVEDAVAVVSEVLRIDAERVFLKRRQKQRGAEQYQRIGTRGERHEVSESGLRFLVNFSDYLDTGLFLDHRPTRRLLASMAPGCSFLNLFCYTGSATVYAAAGGAIRTVSVDTSNTYLAWAKDNMQLNGFATDTHKFVRADAREFLKTSRESYSLIFVDPPTFSNASGTRPTFAVQRDHVALVRECLKKLSSEGSIVFSSNFRRFHLDTAALGDVTVTEITKDTIPPDFERNPHVHCCWLIRRR
jgi:23S rRNA (guanine2445-N2)-methyltransferase / 23S rRNA (guanine2069-N7)-methyltransferase